MFKSALLNSPPPPIGDADIHGQVPEADAIMEQAYDAEEAGEQEAAIKLYEQAAVLYEQSGAHRCAYEARDGIEMARRSMGVKKNMYEE